MNSLNRNDFEAKIRNQIEVLQSMIDISADRLDGLRTQCVTSSELTRQEIRTLETKLVRMFSELLAAKASLSKRPTSCEYTIIDPELIQWLQVVGESSQVK